MPKKTISSKVKKNSQRLIALGDCVHINHKPSSPKSLCICQLVLFSATVISLIGIGFCWFLPVTFSLKLVIAILCAFVFSVGLNSSFCK